MSSMKQERNQSATATSASLEKLVKRLKKYSEADSTSSLIGKKAERTLAQLQSQPDLTAGQLAASGLPAIVNRLRKRLRPEEPAAQTARRLIKAWRLTVESEQRGRRADDDASTSGIQDQHRVSTSESTNSAAAKAPQKMATVSTRLEDKHEEDSSWTPDTNDPMRLKGIEMFQQALQLPSSVATSSPPLRLAAEIEAAVSADSNADPARYRARLRCLLQNLRDPKNPQLRASLLTGQLPAAQFAVMTSEQLASDEMRRLRQRLAEEATARFKSTLSAGSEPGSSLFTCKRCRKKNCTYNQLQTLPGDEPMTTYVLCNECGFRWKFN